MSSLKDKMKKFKGKRTKEATKKRAERENAYGGGLKDPLYIDAISNVLSANKIDGEFRFRILPPFFESEGGHWGYTVYTHYRVGINKKSFNCPKRMLGKACPVCDEVEGETDPAARKEKKGYYPSYGNLVYVIDRDNEKVGPILWRMPFGVEQDILTQSVRGKIDFIDDTEEGFDITISYKKEKNQSFGKWSSVTIDRNESPLSDDEDKAEEWLEFCDKNPLDKVCIIHDFDTIASAHNGQEVLEDRQEKDPKVETEEEAEEKKSSAKERLAKLRKLKGKK